MASSSFNLKIKDEGRLAELGYTQELRREWSWLHNFGASFSIIVRNVYYISIFRDLRLTWVGTMTERCDWHHNPIPLRFDDWWPCCHDHWLDRRQLFHIDRWREHGGDPVVHTNIRRPILLGVHALAATTCTFLFLDHWVVQFIGANCCNQWYRFWPCELDLSHSGGQQQLYSFTWEDPRDPGCHSGVTRRSQLAQHQGSKIFHLFIDTPADGRSRSASHWRSRESENSSTGQLRLLDIL